MLCLMVQARSQFLTKREFNSPAEQRLVGLRTQGAGLFPGILLGCRWTGSPRAYPKRGTNSRKKSLTASSLPATVIGAGRIRGSLPPQDSKLPPHRFTRQSLDDTRRAGTKDGPVLLKRSSHGNAHVVPLAQHAGRLSVPY